MDLPAEIVAHILSRLSIKTIVHCKCVCKEWNILLSGTYFVSLHLSRSPKGLIIHRTERLNIFNLGELDDKFEYHDIINTDPLERLHLRLKHCGLLGSVNGLICLRVAHDDALHRCNPITREHIIIPGDKCNRSSIEEIVTGGFGFVEASNQYKVVTLYLCSNKSDCKIYTLGTGMWRSLGHLPFFESGLQDGRVDDGGTCCCTFFAGKLHWLAHQNDTHNEIVYTFDLEKEIFQLAPSVPRVDGNLSSRSLGMLGGCLCISWTKEIVIKSTYGLYSVQPLDVLKDRTILLSSSGDCLFTYHLESKTLQPLNDVIQLIRDRLCTPFMDTFDAIVYVPSFVRLKSFMSEKVSLF